MKLRTPISDYYQYKERMKSLASTSFENQGGRFASANGTREDLSKGKSKR